MVIAPGDAGTLPNFQLFFTPTRNLTLSSGRYLCSVVIYESFDKPQIEVESPQYWDTNLLGSGSDGVPTITKSLVIFAITFGVNMIIV